MKIKTTEEIHLDAEDVKVLDAFGHFMDEIFRDTREGIIEALIGEIETLLSDLSAYFVYPEKED